MLPISVCMIARDEEQNLPNTLRAVSTLVQEIIMVDTGSTDKTMAVATSYGAAVCSYPWTENFAEAKNHAIEKASQPTILFIDADEQLIESSHDALKRYLQESSQYAGRVILLNQLADSVVKERIPRIFPNQPEYRYHGRIHEQLLFNGAPPQTVDTEITLYHTGYTPSEVSRKDKINRNLALMLCDLAENPEDPYLLFQIGRSHYMNKAYSEAVEYFQRALERVLDCDMDAVYLPSLLLSLGYCLMHLQAWPSFYQLLDEAIGIFPDYTDLYFLYGIGLIEQQNAQHFKDIPGIFDVCLKLGEPDSARYETVDGVGSYRAHYNLGIYYEITQDSAQAIHHFAKAAEAGFQPALQRRQK